MYHTEVVSGIRECYDLCRADSDCKVAHYNQWDDNCEFRDSYNENTRRSRRGYTGVLPHCSKSCQRKGVKCSSVARSLDG